MYKFNFRLGEESSTQTESPNQLQCQMPICFNTFITKSGLKSHMEREHKGKRFVCTFCRKHLSSQFSLNRHILSAHPIDEGEENDRKIETPIIYDKVNEIVPKDQEDTIIQQQSQEIEKLEAIQKSAQDEIKVLRQQLKSMRSNENV